MYLLVRKDEALLSLFIIMKYSFKSKNERESTRFAQPSKLTRF